MAVLYTAAVNSTGGREGHVKSADGILDMDTRKPTAMGGSGEGANPEQLFGAAYATCYGGAVKFVADKQGIEIPDGFSTEAHVSLNLEGANMFLSGEMHVNLPGMDASRAEALANTAYNACVYTKAIKGNIEMTLVVNV
jgi:lipoyl-dependent peroxiredoxin